MRWCWGIFNEKEVNDSGYDPYIIIAIRELFESEGFEVYACSSGVECLEELERGFKGIILMDVMMPHMDGWETVNEIVSREYNKENIILMLSAKDHPEERMYGDKYISDYLLKPFDAKEIVATVKQYSNKLQKIKNH